MSAGMTPDGVMAFQPTKFATHFYLMATDADGREVSLDSIRIKSRAGTCCGPATSTALWKHFRACKRIGLHSAIGCPAGSRSVCCILLVSHSAAAYL